MIQAYFLSVVYLLFSALLFLLDFYRQKLAFMLALRSKLEEKKLYADILFFSGIVISIVLLLAPISPGPVIIGDFVPALFILFSSFYFKFFYFEKSKGRARLYYTDNTLHRKWIGFLYIFIALLHFLFAKLVLI